MPSQTQQLNRDSSFYTTEEQIHELFSKYACYFLLISLD